MFKITLSPQVSDGELVLVKNGDKLHINSDEFDFTTLPEGGIIRQATIGHPFIVSDVKRVAGDLILTVLFPIPGNATPEQCFPPLIEASTDGPIAVPAGPDTEPEDEVEA